MKNATAVLVLSLVALPALVACDKAEPGAVATGPAEVEELQQRMTSLTRNVEAAEAVRSVKRLQWAYGHYSELGLWYDFADLFADTGVGHYVQGDLDRDEIRALFFDQVGQGRLGLAEGRIYPHISFSPVIDLAGNGNEARGRFRILAMLGGYGGNASWFHGVYENAYVKEQGIWKLNEVSNTAQITGNFTAGLSAASNAPLDLPTFAFHYEPAQVGGVTISGQNAAISGVAPDAASGDLRAAAEELASLQQRLARLDDEAQIIRLQHQYGYYLDSHAWDAVAGLFAEQGTFESAQQGVYSGRSSIRNGLNQFGDSGLAPGDVDDHILFQTYVSVAADGRTARARVDQLGLQKQPDGTAQWTQGIYENVFVKENGAWRIRSLHYYPRLITDYHKGWNVDAQPAPGPSTAYPPDAPASETYAIFPAFHIPPFHFAHPVTGRAPQYPPGNPAMAQATGVGPLQAPVTAGNGIADAASLRTQLDAAATQSQRALAVDAVENLVNAYAYYLDECRPQDAALLFATQGENEIPGIGYYQGADRIAQALQLAYCPAGRQQGVLTLHHVLQPLITVDDDGQTAQVTARLWQVHATAADDDYYLMGQLQGTAIRQDAQWKLSSLRTHYAWAVSVKEGWARATQNTAPDYAAPEQMLGAFPPDRPGQATRLAPDPAAYSTNGSR